MLALFTYRMSSSSKLGSSFVYWVQFEYFKVSKGLFLDFLDLALARKFLTANDRKSLVLVYESYFSEKVVEDEAGSD